MPGAISLFVERFQTVKIQRLSQVAALALVGSIALAACGSDNNISAGGDSSASSPAAGDCVAGTLSAEGSSAQKNAIEEAISSYGDKCSGATINYNPTGSGAGIKQEDLVRLFQPYYTTKAGGSGLGLMIAQRIMREHGGHIGIESKEGLGTIVTLQFPRKDRRVRMLQS